MRRSIGGLILAGALAVPSGALANAYTAVQQVYDASGTGVIPACQFSSSELAAASKLAPNYSYEYNSAFTDAIQAALAARADGACAGGGANAQGSGGSGGSGVTGSRGSSGTGGARSTSPLGSGSRLTSGSPALPTSLTAGRSGGLPGVLIGAGILLGLCLLGLAGCLGFGALGHEPGAFRAARHSLREAEYRVGARWEDVTDRLRR